MNCSLKHFAGVENAMRLKSCLDATHQLEPEAVDDEELRLGELRYYGPTASASASAPFCYSFCLAAWEVGNARLG